MSASIQEVLGWKTLTGLIQAIIPGVPDVLPPAFDSFSQEVLFDDGEYTVRPGNRMTGRKVKFGAPPSKRALRDVASQPVKLFHFSEEQDYEAKVLMKLRSATSYERDKALEEFTSQVSFFNEYFTNMQKTLKLWTLRSPTIWFDGDGQLLPSSSGAVDTITMYTRRPGNSGQLDIDGSGAIIGASWGTAATNIPLHLRKIKKAGMALSGYEPRYIMYGVNIPTYITENDFVKDYLARNPSKNAEFLNSGEIGELFDYIWVPAYKQFWKSGESLTSEGTTNFIMGDDEILITPEPSKAWWERLDGSYPVPTNINITTSIDAAFDQIKLVTGKFAYARVDPANLSAVLRCGHTFFYAMKVPNAVFLGDVTP